MPTLKKLLSKFNREDRQILESLIDKIISLDWYGLDVKKLKGENDIFRVRKGKVRIIYQIRYGQIFILKVGHRKEDTYKL